MTLKDDVIFKEQLTGVLKKNMTNLVNFHANSCTSENLHLLFHGLLLFKAYKVLNEKVQKGYVS